MSPVLFKIGDVPIYAHGFFVLLGLIVGLVVLALEARRRHWPKEEVIPITLAAFVGGMIGARVSMLFFHGWEETTELILVAAIVGVLWIFRQALLSAWRIPERLKT